MWELDQGFVLPVMTQFLSNLSQYIVVDDCRSKLVAPSGVRSDSGKYFGSAVVPPVHRGAFIHTEERFLRLCGRLHLSNRCAIKPSNRIVCGLTCGELN